MKKITNEILLETLEVLTVLQDKNPLYKYIHLREESTCENKHEDWQKDFWELRQGLIDEGELKENRG